MPFDPFGIRTGFRARKAGSFYKQAAKKIGMAQVKLLKGLSIRERESVMARRLKRFGEIQDALNELNASINITMGRICKAVAAPKKK